MQTVVDKEPVSNFVGDEDFSSVLESKRFTQFQDSVAQMLNPAYQDDYQWDSTAVGRWETLAKTLPPIVTRGAIVVERGKPHFKGPPRAECPQCHGKLTRGTATLTFRHAPSASQWQQVEAWMCSCGEFYVAGEIAREAYMRAFGRASERPQQQPGVPVNHDRPETASVWTAIDAFRNRLAATGRDFGDSAESIREDRER